jgi:hypothetical protein
MAKDHPRTTVANTIPKTDQPTPPPTKRINPGPQRIREEHKGNARTAKHHTLEAEGGPSNTDPGGIKEGHTTDGDDTCRNEDSRAAEKDGTRDGRSKPGSR